MGTQAIKNAHNAVDRWHKCCTGDGVPSDSSSEPQPEAWYKGKSDNSNFLFQYSIESDIQYMQIPICPHTPTYILIDAYFFILVCFKLKTTAVLGKLYLQILISGNITSRHGVLLLTRENMTVLGGEVESLLITNALENVLARKL